MFLGDRKIIIVVIEVLDFERVKDGQTLYF